MRSGELEEVEDHQTTGASFGRQVTWDGLGQLQRSTYSQGGIVSDVRYQRDREGRIVSQNRLLRQGTTQDRTFRGYKYQQGGALEQLIEAVGNATPSGAATDTTWASVQAAGASLSGQRFEYTRDVEGSPLQVLRVDVGGQLPRFTSPTRRRGFQMESFTLNGSAAQTVTHDTAGRMTQEFGRTYSWDEFHSLVRAWVPSGSNEQAFQYDAFGRLVAVRRGTTNWPIEEELAYDGTQMVAAWNFEETQLWNAQWGQGVDNLVSVRMGTTGTEAFALKDGRGNVTGYYRGQGSTPGLWVTAEYTPEGRVTQKDWTTSGTCTETGLTKCPRMGGVPFGFHSAYKSPAHGLLYFRNRWYSAEAGQWLSQDPLGEVDSANLYAFNAFDSVNFIDPFGLESEGPAVQTEPGGQCKSNEQGCKPGPGEVNYVTERPKFDPFLIQNAQCQFANNCLTNNLAKLDGQVNGPRQPATPEEPTKAPGPTLTRLRQGVRTALEFVAVKDQLLAKIVGSPSGANIGPDVGSKMGKLMDEGVSLQEAIKTSLNMTLNPTWPVLEHSSAASDAASNGQTGRFVFHAVAAFVSTVALVGMVSGVGSSGGGGAPVRGFHGTTRANVLGILNKGGFIPKNGQVWLSRLLGDAFQHGGDKAAGAAFAIEVELAAGVAGESVSVPGNPFSIVVKGTGLVQGTVKTLFVRTKDGEGGFQTQVISGQAAIRSFLEK